MKPDSKTFCVLPWIHIATKPDGAFRVCCKQDNNYKLMKRDVEAGREERILRVQDQGLEYYWNSGFIQKCRKELLAGEWYSGCAACKKMEDMGGFSKRMKENKKYEELIESRTFEIEDHSHPIDFEVRHGNICNLKCKICFFTSSSQIAKEEVATLPNPIPGHDILLNVGNDLVLDWANQVGDEWFEWLQYTKSMYILGGEPTIDPGIDKMLDFFIEEDLAKNISFRFNTNVTNIDKKLIEKFNQFEKVIIILSVDGIEKIQEYTRFPSKWSKIKENMFLLKTYCNSTVELSLMPAISIYNILYFREFLEWIDTNYQNVQVGYNVVRVPEFLSFNLIPLEKRLEIADDLEEHHAKRPLMTIGTDYLSFEYLIRNLRDEKPSPNHLYKKFWELTDRQDNYRGTYLKDELPELYEIMKDFK